MPPRRTKALRPAPPPPPPPVEEGVVMVVPDDPHRSPPPDEEERTAAADPVPNWNQNLRLRRLKRTHLLGGGQPPCSSTTFRRMRRSSSLTSSSRILLGSPSFYTVGTNVLQSCPASTFYPQKALTEREKRVRP